MIDIDSLQGDLHPALLDSDATAQFGPGCLMQRLRMKPGRRRGKDQVELGVLHALDSAMRPCQKSWSQKSANQGNSSGGPNPS